MRAAFLIQFVVISIILTFLSCKSKEAVVEETTMPNTKAVLSELFQEKKYHCKMNESGDMQLCYADDEPQGDRLRKIYAVYDSNYNMIYGPKKVHGTVDWSDDDSLTVEVLPRVLHREDSGNQTKKKIINIREIHKL